jgi:ketosteroid isomerase-like protein
VNDGIDVNTLAQRVQELQDRVDIAEIMARYGRLLDAKDWPAFAELFAEDMTTQHSVVAPPMHGRDTFVGFLSSFEPNMRSCQHFVTNTAVDVHGDEADMRAFILAMHDVEQPDGTSAIVPAGGDYEVHLRREAAGWKIDRLIVHETWIDPRVPAIYAPPISSGSSGASGD